MKCDRLEEYLTRTLDAQNAKSFEQHLLECVECRLLVNEDERLIRLIVDGVNAEQPSPEATARIVQLLSDESSVATVPIVLALKNQQPQGDAPGSLRRRYLLVLGAAAMVFFLASMAVAPRETQDIGSMADQIVSSQIISKTPQTVPAPMVVAGEGYASLPIESPDPNISIVLLLPPTSPSSVNSLP